jgi:MFS family permease
MTPSNLFRAAIYYGTSLVLGVALILIPASSFIIKSPDASGITDQQYGLLFLPMISAAILATFFLDRVVRRMGRRKVFYAAITCVLAYHLGLAGLTRTVGNNLQSFMLLLGAELALGAGFGSLLAILNLLVVELFPEHRDPALTGLHGFLGVGCALSPLVVSFYYERGIWQQSVWMTFGVLAVFALAAVAGRAVPPEDRSHPDEFHPIHLKGAGPLPLGARLFLAASVCYGMAESIIGNWTILFLTEEKTFSLQTASVCLSLFWTFVTVGRVLAAFLTLKVEARFLHRISPVLTLAGLLLVLGTASEIWIPLPYIVVGLGCSYFFPLNISLATQYHDRWREVLSALSVTGLMLGVGLGSTVVGFLRDWHVINLQFAFGMATGCAVVLAFLSVALTTESPRASREG